MSMTMYGFVWLSVVMESVWGKFFVVPPDLPLVVSLMGSFQILRRPTFDKWRNEIHVFALLSWTGFLCGLYSVCPVEIYVMAYEMLAAGLYLWGKCPWAKFRETEIGFVLLASVLLYIGIAIASHQTVSGLIGKPLIETTLVNGVLFFILRALRFDKSHKNALRFVR